MRLQLLLRPHCIDCQAVKILVRRIKPDYPDLDVEPISLTAQPDLATKYGLGSTPGIVLNGKPIAKKHIKEAELRRALLRRRQRRPR